MYQQPSIGAKTIKLLEENIGVGGLPWWSSGKESAFQCRGRGFPGRGTKIPHVAGQLSLRSAAAEPTRLS